jgi:FtsH-binding integral membrane protein
LKKGENFKLLSISFGVGISAVGNLIYSSYIAWDVRALRTQ